MRKKPKVEALPVRKAIPPSVRFEVFKRDDFTCQYCGKKAPDVILHVDHIKPVADGGQNDILNLLTACVECNGGKGARAIDDSAMIDKQRRQLEELNERRNQLEMMVKWREDLHGLTDGYVQLVQSEFLKYGPYTANETAERDIAKWVRKYTMDETFKAIETSFHQYLRSDDEGKVTGESWSRAFNAVPKIIEVNRKGGLPESLRVAFYCRGILRRRLEYLREDRVMKILNDMIAAGSNHDSLIDFCKHQTTWSRFEAEADEFLSGGYDGPNP